MLVLRSADAGSALSVSSCCCFCVLSNATSVKPVRLCGLKSLPTRPCGVDSPKRADSPRRALTRAWLTSRV
jgi:hypothetical protein